MYISQNAEVVFNVKSSTYYFHVKRKILADFQVCIIVPLRSAIKIVLLKHVVLIMQIINIIIKMEDIRQERSNEDPIGKLNKILK